MQLWNNLPIFCIKGLFLWYLSQREPIFWYISIDGISVDSQSSSLHLPILNDLASLQGRCSIAARQMQYRCNTVAASLQSICSTTISYMQRYCKLYIATLQYRYNATILINEKSEPYSPFFWPFKLKKLMFSYFQRFQPFLN